MTKRAKARTGTTALSPADESLARVRGTKMNTVYHVYEPGKLKPIVGAVDWPKKPTYDDIKALTRQHIDGWLEHVTVLFEGKRCDMLVDEEGLLKHLPLNEAATRIYWTMSGATSGSPIVGTAILFPERRIWF